MKYKRSNISSSNILSISLDIALGTVGGLICGFVAQWLYAKLFADKDNKSIAFNDTVTYFGPQYILTDAGKAAYNLATVTAADLGTSTLDAYKAFFNANAQPSEVGKGKFKDLKDQTLGLRIYRNRADTPGTYWVQPGYASGGNPLMGLLLLQLLNGLCVMGYHMLVGRYANQRSGLAQSMFVMSLYILELDDLLAFSQRIAATFGGDPLRYGRGITESQRGDFYKFAAGGAGTQAVY